MKRGSGIIFLGAIVLTLITAGCAEGSKNTASSEGKIATDQYFVLKSVDGSELSLGKELGAHKAVLLNFWATWCPPCREEIPDLIKMQEKYKDAPFTILGVDVGESPSRVGGFVKKMGMNYPIALDRDNAISEKYGIVGIPTSLLLAPDGTVLGEYHSYTRQLESDVKKALQ